MSSPKQNHPNTKITMHVAHRQHLQHPIPVNMEITPIGKTLTELEWNKFIAELSQKEMQYCQRTLNGHIVFQGEGGLAALKQFHSKFNSRFKFKMTCDNLEHAIEGTRLATKQGIQMAEICYKNGHELVSMVQDARALPRRTR